MLLYRKKAQAAAEYAALMAILIAAVLAIRVYYERAIQGKVREMARQISPFQYNPTKTDSTTITTTTGSATFNMEAFETRADTLDTTKRDSKEVSENEDVIIQE